MADAAIVLSKVRQALVVYLTDANVGTANIYDGKRAGEKEAPCVLCGASSAIEDPPDTGNFWVTVEVSVKSIGAVDAGEAEETPKDESETLTTAVFNAMELDDLPSSLSSSLADFTCIGVGEQKEMSSGEDGDCWVDTLKLQMYCAASQL